MSLPQIKLDDRHFQELVSEARMRIAQSCPEWTEHNVSDPGITLIELFAWMTDMLIYRVNRVPDKLHVALLELLGIELHGPTAARTNVRFRLAAPPDQPVEIPAGTTEVATLRTASDESIVFQVATDFSIPPLKPAAYVVERGGQYKTIAVADGAARPQGPDRFPFATPPQIDDALYLGFDETIWRACWSESTSTARWRAARASIPRIRRCAGRSARQTAAGPRRMCSPTAPAASTTAPATIELQCPAESGGRGDRRQAPALAALPDRGRDSCRRTPARPTRIRPRSTRSRRRRSALGRRRARRARGRRDSRRQRRHAWPGVPAALLPGAATGRRRVARGPGARR